MIRNYLNKEEITKVIWSGSITMDKTSLHEIIENYVRNNYFIGQENIRFRTTVFSNDGSCRVEVLPQ